MFRRLSLRARITLSFTLFAALLSGVIAYAVSLTVDDIEREIVDERVQSELQFVLKSGHYQHDKLQQITFDTQYYYWQNKTIQPSIPQAILHLSVGLHRWSNGKQSSYILISEHQQARIFLIKEATEFENREHAIRVALIIVVLLSISAGFLIGRMLSSQVISPVTKLAEQVAALNTNSALSEITSQYANDEVGKLALTFKQYLTRMRQFIQREQSFTSDASHELRTPLAIIQGATELLKESDNLSNKEQKQLDRIHRASQRMVQILEVLLMLARENPNEKIQSNTRCQVQEVVLETVEQYRNLIGSKPVKLNSQLIEDFSINSDKHVLLIVIGNIIKNAIEHTAQGEVKIIVEKNKVTIVDTGQGMSLDTQQHIFERFFQASQTKIGSGIGLSIVKRICDQQGWEIKLHSELGVGTTFQITLC